MNALSRDDLFMCKSSVATHFFQVGNVLFQLEVHPFLTHSQRDGEINSDWFSSCHLQEVSTLLEPVLQKYMIKECEDGTKSSEKPKDCVLTAHKDGGVRYQELFVHGDKVVIYVCPRVSSSALQLSQLVNSEPNKNKQDDISRYFQLSETHASC